MPDTYYSYIFWNIAIWRHCLLIKCFIDYKPLSYHVCAISFHMFCCVRTKWPSQTCNYAKTLTISNSKKIKAKYLNEVINMLTYFSAKEDQWQLLHTIPYIYTFCQLQYLKLFSLSSWECTRMFFIKVYYLNILDWKPRRNTEESL